MAHIISELTPKLTKIIEQGIECGDIDFDYPSAPAEIVLIVLSVKLDNTLVPSTSEEIENTVLGLISLLEKVPKTPKVLLIFLFQIVQNKKTALLSKMKECSLYF